MENAPKLIRVSRGSEFVLGLKKGFAGVKPTTAYLLTYHPKGCSANCAFCAQARTSISHADRLSRVVWPLHSLQAVVQGLRRAEAERTVRRICLQTLNYPGMFAEVLSLVNVFKAVRMPVSLSCQPLEEEEIRRLKEAGLDRLVFPLDAATEEVFERVKGAGVGNPFTRSRCLTALEKAVEIFGEDKVGSYLMVGLGERERETVAAVQELKELGVFTSLFAFTPLPGTLLGNQPKPPLVSYRKIQLAHFLIDRGFARFEDMTFTEKGELAGFGLDGDILEGIVASGLPFQTQGCAGCNRPYYNEDPRGPLYNYPRPLTEAEVSKIAAALKPYLNSELRR